MVILFMTADHDLNEYIIKFIKCAFGSNCDNFTLLIPAFRLLTLLYRIIVKEPSKRKYGRYKDK